MEAQKKRTKVALNKKLKILVAEDNGKIKKQIKDGLVDIGFIRENIKTFNNGKDAWTNFVAEANAGEPFELVFTDVEMPFMSGIEFLDRIRKCGNEKIDSVPVIIISSKDDKETVFDAIVKGASNYILKPFSDGKVKERLLEVFYPQNK